jgi:hypothetical protein
MVDCGFIVVRKEITTCKIYIFAKIYFVMTFFDPIRRKNVTVTPEERVRQRLIQYLHSQSGVPLSLIAVEKELIVNNLPKRYDAVVFNNSGEPLLLAECKAPHITLGSNVLRQAAQYNLLLHTPFLVITNGKQTYCCHIEFVSQTITQLPAIPAFAEMNSVNVVVNMVK